MEIPAARVLYFSEPSKSRSTSKMLGPTTDNLGAWHDSTLCGMQAIRPPSETGVHVRTGCGLVALQDALVTPHMTSGWLGAYRLPSTSQSGWRNSSPSRLRLAALTDSATYNSLPRRLLILHATFCVQKARETRLSYSYEAAVLIDFRRRGDVLVTSGTASRLLMASRTSHFAFSGRYDIWIDRVVYRLVESIVAPSHQVKRPNEEKEVSRERTDGATKWDYYTISNDDDDHRP